MKTKQNIRLNEITENIEREYSGKLIVRFSKENHRELARIAYRKNMSINLLLNIMIDEGIRKERNREKRRIDL